MQTGLAIKVVAARTGVSVHTLRAWERRYGVPSPGRVPSNRYRIYDDQDIADVLWMKKQIQAGLSPAQAAVLFHQQQRKPVGLGASAQPIAATQAELAAALVNSDEARARHLLDESFALYSLEQIALQIIEPAMREIGDRWLRNEITVWQEHLATTMIHEKLSAILQSQPAMTGMAPLVVAVCAPAEEHELGLLLFALLARQQGWRVTYLGQGMPLEDIAHVVHASKPTVVVVSVTTVMGLAGLMPWLVAANRPDTSLVFAGRLLNLVPTLREHLPGVFLGEDALNVACALASLRPRSEFWSPSKRAWNAVQALQAQRLKIAGETASQFMAAMPARMLRRWNVVDVNFATLYLVDALVCALAFGAPEIVDLQRTWLAEAMPPRGVSAELIGRHLSIFARVMKKSLGNSARAFKPLLARMNQE